jgi:hypothetical protein
VDLIVDRRALRHPFRMATQSTLATSSHGGAAAGLMSFVKLNRPAADFIWDNQYYLTPTLAGLNAKFDRERTAVVASPTTWTQAVAVTRRAATAKARLSR